MTHIEQLDAKIANINKDKADLNSEIAALKVSYDSQIASLNSNIAQLKVSSESKYNQLKASTNA